MKIKKIKLLKALAMTGAFGIVATVPVIVSACSSTSDNNTGGNTGGGNQQTQKVTPVLKDSVSLKGSLSKIFDTSTDTTSRKTTTDLITEDVKLNPENYFTNGGESAVKDAVKDATVTVKGEFSNSEWTGDTLLPYDSTDGTWKKDTTTVTIDNANKLVYATELDQINISSLNDLKTQLSKDGWLKNTLEKSGAATIDAAAKLSVENRLGFTNDDLLHVNVKSTNGSNETNYDLQIPVSDINLSVPNLSIEVSGDNIETSTKTTTKYDFNIGIDSTVHFNQGTTEVTATAEDQVKVDEVLEKLGFAKKNGSNTELDNNALIKGLGIYNVTFSGQTITKKESTTPSTRAQVDTVYTVSLKATPTADKNYVWADDGTSTEKTITFDVTIKIGTA